MSNEKVEVELKENNFILLSFRYAVDLVVPYADGIKIHEALSRAEVYENNFKSEVTIKPIGKDDFNSRIISHKDYAEAKTKQLLMGDSPKE